MVASLSRMATWAAANHQRLRTVDVRERQAGLRAANARPDDLPERLIVEGGHRGRSGRLTSCCRRRRGTWRQLNHERCLHGCRPRAHPVSPSERPCA